MKKRPQTAGKKKVGFALKGTKIEAPEDGYPDHGQKKISTTLLEFRVEKAREFETFKQIPKFTHAPLAVIHPSPEKVERKMRHVAPSTLAFDSTKASFNSRRFE
jgi:ASC-1-like (ASCH) protein